jgi:hypothetical protein
LQRLTTRQRSCSFYLAWFTRIYTVGDSGWFVRDTPDGRPLFEQDAFFWQAIETVARTMNVMLAEERNRK